MDTSAVNYSLQKLASFIKIASKKTYMGGGIREENPERLGFTELVYAEGKFSYRDSYTGFYRSWGTETVRFDDKPIWTTLYGGGMEKGKENQALDTFKFLKAAISSKDETSNHFRGPDSFEEGDWKYTYRQKGDIANFSGEEEIYHKGELVFTHKIIGGLIVSE